MGTVQRGVDAVASELYNGYTPEWVLLMLDGDDLIGMVCYSLFQRVPEVVIGVGFGAVAVRAQGNKHGKTLMRATADHLRDEYGSGRATFRVDRSNDESIGLCRSMGVELTAAPEGRMLAGTVFF